MIAEQLVLPLGPVEEAARAYVNACRSAEQADSFRLTEAWGAVAETFHDLCVAVAGDCTICDSGSCPGLIQTAAIKGGYL